MGVRFPNAEAARQWPERYRAAMSTDRHLLVWTSPDNKTQYPYSLSSMCSIERVRNGKGWGL